MPRTLSEADSKALLRSHGLEFAPEVLVADADSAVAAAEGLGYPVAAKLCGDDISHKTERSLVRLGLRTAAEVAAATTDLLGAVSPEDHATGVLVAPMVTGTRELIAGIATDEQFGPTVLLGLGGILAEAIADVTVRLAPLDPVDAHDMIDSLGAQNLLGAFRGEPAVDRDALAAVLMALSGAATTPGPDGVIVRSADLNPLIVAGGVPVPVDALVELEDQG